MQSKWNCTIIALAMAMMLGAVDIHAVCENATSNAEWWPGDVKFSYSTVTCKGKVEEQIISETSDLIDSVTVPCNVTETTPTITKTITTGASGTLSVSGTLTLGASATAEAGIAGFGKVGGSTSVSSSVTVGANGTISSTESVSVTCNWTVPPCLNWQGEMRQDVKEFTTIQKITQCTKRTITALPSNPARVGESVLRGPLKTAKVTIEGNVRRGKSCSDMILGPCPDKKDGTGIPQESVTESGEKPDDDQDGSPNDEENYRGTDPYNPDTDEDGLSDPVDPCPLDPDCDGDSVEDGSEVTALNTDPQNPDSDDDGILDSKDVFPTLNPNPTINLYDVFPSGNVTGLGSSGREVLISGILEPFPPVLEVVVGGNLMVVFPTDKTFSLAPIELTPGAHTVNFYAVSGNGESANREAIGSVDFQLQQGGPCLFCQDVVDDTLDRACHEFAASPPTSEAGMANIALDILNETLSTAELCDAGQSVGGSAAACQDDLFRLLGVSLPVPEKVPEVILGFTFVETNPEGYPEYRHDSTDIRFVRLPGGSFDMGSPAEEPGHSPDQGPVHTVTLSPFLIAKYEVTQAEYESVMTGNTAGLEASPSSDKGDKLPVVRVSWDDLYLEDGFLERTGLALPSEAQWEYACRAGTSGAYAGNGVLDDMGWFLDNSGGTSHEVGGKRPNQFGLHDMYGNVLEWCEDVYRERFYDEVQDGLDPVSKSGQDVSPYELGVMRGGAFDVAAQDSRSSSRFSDMRSAPLRRGSIGFRPARPLPVIEPEPEPLSLSLSFQSTVTSTKEWDNGLPHGVEDDATVTFFLNQFNFADMTLTDAESCNESDSRGDRTTTVTGCYKNTWELPVNSTYTLTYSSGYTHTATVTKIEIHNNGVEEICRTRNGEVDCRTKKENDSIFFYDGSNKLYEVRDLSNKSGTWLEGEISSDFTTAIEGIDTPDIFDLSFYWGDWGDWGTYHYDYKEGPQETTVVIKTP